jgi:hypothetical protein
MPTSGRTSHAAAATGNDTMSPDRQHMDEQKYIFNWKAQRRIHNRAIVLGYEPQDFPWLLKILQEQVNERLQLAPRSSMHVEFPLRAGASHTIDDLTVSLQADCFEND